MRTPNHRLVPTAASFGWTAVAAAAQPQRYGSVVNTIILALALLSTAHATPQQVEPLLKVFSSPGVYSVQNSNCPVKLSVGEGGATRLYLGGTPSQDRVINDVNGVGFLTPQIIVFSVSPIYGSPGIFLYNCDSKQLKRIVAPKTVNKAYPDGADYFELFALEKAKVHFYYARDVEEANFDNFRTKDNSFEVSPNGSGFRRSTEK